MKTAIIILTLFISGIYAKTDFRSLLKLHDNKDFFKFIKTADNAALKIWQDIYVKALIHNLQNENAVSNNLIHQVFNEHSEELTDSLKMKLLETRIKNSVNLYDYKDAVYSSEQIIGKFASLLDSNELTEMKNSLVIWKAAENLAVQTIEITGDSKIPVSKDMAGLINVPVNCREMTEDFIFDTGANFSVVSSSYAKKLKMKMLEGELLVGSVTGKKIKSRLAYADLIEIGNMKFRNVLFLVIPDESLTFAGGLYVINGIIGLPVIKEMKELHIRKDELFIPANQTYHALNNLLIDGFVPVIEVVNNNDSLAFTFDTGAKTTMLYSSYYQLNKKVIDSKYKPVEIEIGGAGGTIKVNGFKLNDLIFRIGTSRFRLDKVDLVSERIKDHDKSFYGNLGQDYMSEFSEMILNFKDMYVDFKK